MTVSSHVGAGARIDERAQEQGGAEHDKDKVKHTNHPMQAAEPCTNGWDQTGPTCPVPALEHESGRDPHKAARRIGGPMHKAGIKVGWQAKGMSPRKGVTGLVDIPRPVCPDRLTCGGLEQ